MTTNLREEAAAARSAPLTDRRGSLRGRTLLKGRIEFGHKRANLDCVLRDLSEGGARLLVSESVPLPEEFDLHLAHLARTRRAQVRWRGGTSVGVQFLDDQGGRGEESEGGEAAGRIKELEAEVRKLRRLLADLRSDPSRISVIFDEAR